MAPPTARRVRPPETLAQVLTRLHDGPAQDAATLKLALLVWEQAVARGDVVVAGEMVKALRATVETLIAGISAIQHYGRECIESEPDSIAGTDGTGQP